MSTIGDPFGERASTYTMPLNKDDQRPPTGEMS